MTTRFRIGLMCCAGLVAACLDETANEDPANDQAALRAQPSASLIDAAVGEGSTTPLDAAASGDGSDAVAAPVDTACEQLTYANTGAPFFATYCAGCHRLPQPTFNTLAEVRNLKPRIQVRLFESPRAPMPPPNAPLQPTAEAKQKLQQWLRCEPLD